MECTQDKSRDSRALYRDCPWQLAPEDGTTSAMQATTLQSIAMAVLVAAQGRAKVTLTFQAADQAPTRQPANTPSAIAEEHTFISKADANIAFASMPGTRHSHWSKWLYVSMPDIPDQLSSAL